MLGAISRRPAPGLHTPVTWVSRVTRDDRSAAKPLQWLSPITVTVRSGSFTFLQFLLYCLGVFGGFKCCLLFVFSVLLFLFLFFFETTIVKSSLFLLFCVVDPRTSNLFVNFIVDVEGTDIVGAVFVERGVSFRILISSSRIFID